MKNKLIIFLVAVLVFLPNTSLLTAGLGQAGDNLINAGKNAGVSDDTDITLIIGVSIQTALAFIGLIFMALMIYAGYLWMTARGEEEPIKKAQKIITACVIGLILVVSAFAITRLIIARFTS